MSATRPSQHTACGIGLTFSLSLSLSLPNKCGRRALQKRQRGGGTLAAVQEEVLSESSKQGEESECSEGAKEADGEQEQEVEGQWRRGGGALKLVFRVQG